MDSINLAGSFPEIIASDNFMRTAERLHLMQTAVSMWVLEEGDARR